MIQVSEKLKISKLLINKEFSYKSVETTINMCESGEEISLRKINIIRRLSDLTSLKSIRSDNQNFSEVLNIQDDDNIRWDLLLGKDYCVNYTKNLISEIEYSKSFLTTYHTTVLPRRKKLYENLTQIIDPDGKRLEVPVYNHSGVSGRTSIKKGFNFLTSSKDFRSKCKSLEKNNILVGIDFKACEPNFYLRSIGKSVKDPDIYRHLVQELGINIENREKLKRGILSVLYGASDETAARILGGNKKMLKSIKKFFKVEETTALLKEDFSDKKFILNAYGRPIFSDKSILNKWIQSSAVDFCSLAFLNFLEEHNLRAAYLVHDEMVVDCNRDQYEEIKNIKELSDPVTKLSVPVEIKVVST
jgi:hypothetical protein